MSNEVREEDQETRRWTLRSPITIKSMSTLREELEAKKSAKDIEGLRDIESAMKATRDSVADVIEKENDKWIYDIYKRKEIYQINANIRLVKEAINSIVN